MKSVVIIVMGVSGSGKSTVASQLSSALGVSFIDGDNLHPRANVEKMATGTPLTDDDRFPWLQQIAQTAANYTQRGLSAVIVCSALKRAYRDIIRHACDNCVFLFLDGDRALLAKRMQNREGHFMKVDMLDSQLATLERPQDDEKDVISMPVTLTPEEIVTQTVTLLAQ
ncbi:gluconokinase [Alteromonas sp. H39]|uniref:gluconokinase n=1 Tax=Alteromonas sp. H39 TaxID=3389876 RepID=UPI0039E119E9